ncbi:MAG: hypothetical protein R3B96_24050 [Pirellulaceae bacterium]
MLAPRQDNQCPLARCPVGRRFASVVFALFLVWGSARPVTAWAQSPDLLQELMRALQSPSSPSGTTASEPSNRPQAIDGLGRVYAPLGVPAGSQPLDVQGDGQRFTVRAPASTLGEVVSALARTSAVDIVLAGDAKRSDFLEHESARLEEILNAALHARGTLGVGMRHGPDRSARPSRADRSARSTRHSAGGGGAELHDGGEHSNGGSIATPRRSAAFKSSAVTQPTI